ncbi:MAG: UDP-N-acetylglucosamine--N-acetylmuramyl-(pentapeptide) pyrophosphoryl-undecaprenol N-acetylglucosamine transferase [Wolbachia endosymbiont of Fragariocoptes setiger]|nr:UDP-N-acetylglucosamine--N-acetylmuramyl-(pentapeptide) pyrophosphoryl-undecaprenol N-acetylglucosamine transferase [Wolbachia endosymbiont of Fragariocoptes setiger]
MKIILATGGTGGHIFPAITLAKELKKHKCIIFTDRQIIEIKSVVLPLSKPSANKFIFYLSLFCSCILTLYKMRKLKPDLVIGFGSYASFPTLLAAKILSIPIILHEQNIILGRVNRMFLENARFVATSFPVTKYAEEDKCIFTGNFIDQKILTNYKITNSLNLLIIAGSQGANFFDDIITSIICDLPEVLKKRVIVIQQCTKKNIDKVKNLYTTKKINFELNDFFSNLKEKLSNAHLVISRAGATSIAEITLAACPAIYIPYLYSKDNHQFYNAKYVADLGSALLIEQNNELKERLKNSLIDLLNNPKKLIDMSDKAKKTKLKNGVKEFIKIIQSDVEIDRSKLTRQND